MCTRTTQGAGARATREVRSSPTRAVVRARARERARGWPLAELGQPAAGPPLSRRSRSAKRHGRRRLCRLLRRLCSSTITGRRRACADWPRVDVTQGSSAGSSPHYPRWRNQNLMPPVTAYGFSTSGGMNKVSVRLRGIETRRTGRAKARSGFTLGSCRQRRHGGALRGGADDEMHGVVHHHARGPRAHARRALAESCGGRVRRDDAEGPRRGRGGRQTCA